MTSAEVRQKYLDFFKARGYAVIPSASLVPENDPTTLFTSSGMQPLVPYLLGEAHPLGQRLVNSQKSFRAEDIEEVGDNRHTTFFEMLGNWSLGDYFKREQLPWFFEFVTESIGLDPKRLYVSVFAGDEKNNVPRDTEAVEIWKKVFANKGIDAKDVEIMTEAHGGEVGMQGGRIFYYEAKKNWWSRSGPPEKMPAGEPGGPDSEMFFDFFPELQDKCLVPGFGNYCHPNCDCGRFMEIGNSVFMEYQKQADGTFQKLPQQNVDFGGGLERITAASNNDPDVFTIDTLGAIVRKISELAATEYKGSDLEKKKAFRVVADHARAAIFLMVDGAMPSNKERGYVVRRLLRRAVRYMDIVGMQPNTLEQLVQVVGQNYGRDYPEVLVRAEFVATGIREEEEKFRKTLELGRKKLLGLAVNKDIDPNDPAAQKEINEITGTNLFDMYQSYGYPLELSLEVLEKEILPQLGLDWLKDRKEMITSEFMQEFQKHKELSRTASAGTFKGGLADSSERVTQFHTTHHLLLKALQMVLGPEVKQRGSNITGERLRIDFSHPTKMTEEEKKKVEEIVNQKIAEDLPVIRSVLDKEEAEKLGAEHEFGQKYPDKVSVYSVGPKDATLENPKFKEAFSIEFCGGPHVTHTGEIKGQFRILKEEAVAAGIRRIKAVAE